MRGMRAIGLAALLLAGCTLAPRKFRDLNDPAPLVRARAVALGEELPKSVVVPALLERLDDGDPVVRLTAHEELKRRTGQDFGYHPWDEAAERQKAVSLWRAWWEGRLAPASSPSPRS
jgi:HEAT repeat protein